jgi:hypothetical protein
MGEEEEGKVTGEDGKTLWEGKNVGERRKKAGRQVFSTFLVLLGDIFKSRPAVIPLDDLPMTLFFDTNMTIGITLVRNKFFALL